MSTSLTAFKSRTYRELYEGLEEIFDSQPFMTSFTLIDKPDWIETGAFGDRKGNKIRVYFHKWGRSFYELDFTFNGNTFKESETSYSFLEFSELLRTVAEVTSQFLEEYKPRGVRIRGEDDYLKSYKNTKVEGQKSRIYRGFISRVVDLDNKYSVSYNDKSGVLDLMRISEK